MDVSARAERDKVTELLLAEEVTAEATVALVRRFEEKVGVVDDVNVCQVCGVADFHVVVALDLASCACLALGGEEVKRFERIPLEFRKHMCVWVGEQGLF